MAAMIPDVDRARFGVPDAVDGPLLQGAQEFGLRSQVEVAYFVEKQGAAMGCLEFAHAPLDAGSDPPFDAEKFRFYELGRANGRGDHHGASRREITVNAVHETLTPLLRQIIKS